MHRTSCAVLFFSGHYDRFGFGTRVVATIITYALILPTTYSCRDRDARR